LLREHERLKIDTALTKMAENARELGLSYDDEPKIGRVNHDCDQCRGVQEPVAWMNPHGGFLSASYIDEFASGLDKEIHNIPLYIAPPAPQPVPVKTYHDGKPWPVAPKPWVGLTDEEVMQTMSGDWTSQFYFARAIEAKLREKNGGAA
jgi:hypothetical protein